MHLQVDGFPGILGKRLGLVRSVDKDDLGGNGIAELV
jgi:hypothetical protein